MSPLPARLRGLTPDRLRDDPRLRALALGLGVIPPRAMHSDADVGLLLDAARGARRVVEIGVYEGGSALALCAALAPGTELHLVDPFGGAPTRCRAAGCASERVTRRVVARAVRRRGAQAPRVRWHVALSHEVAASWSGEVDLVFVDGDHSETGCELDWSSCETWSSMVATWFSTTRAPGCPAGAGCRARRLWCLAACAAAGRPAGRSSPRQIAPWWRGVSWGREP